MRRSETQSVSEVGPELKVVFERALFKAVIEKMRSAIELLESGGTLPTDEHVAGAGILCADAGTLLRSICDERRAAGAQVEGKEARDG